MANPVLLESPAVNLTGVPGVNMSQESLVEIRDLSKVYERGGVSVAALDHVSLDIAQGEFLSLMGPSGSGKSTLLHVIAGIDRPTGGSCKVGKVFVTELTESELADWRNQNVGFVFQSFNLIPVLSAYENVELPLLLMNLPGSKRKQLVNDMERISLPALGKAVLYWSKGRSAQGR